MSFDTRIFAFLRIFAAPFKQLCLPASIGAAIFSSFNFIRRSIWSRDILVICSVKVRTGIIGGQHQLRASSTCCGIRRAISSCPPPSAQVRCLPRPRKSSRCCRNLIVVRNCITRRSNGDEKSTRCSFSSAVIRLSVNSLGRLALV